CTEALEGLLGIEAKGFLEGIESLCRHRFGPLGVGAEARIAGNGDQTRAGIDTTRCQLTGQHATQRPTGQPGITRQIAVQLIQPGIGVGQLRQRSDGYLKVRQLLTKRIAQRLQRRSTESPTGQEDQLNGHCQGSSAKEFQHSAKASSRCSTCAWLCDALKVTRSRALPAGTVGGRMAPTRMPRSRSAAESCRARSLLPTMIGWIGVGLSTRLRPISAAP